MKIKIVESNCTPALEKLINKLLKKGWKIKGNVFLGVECLTIVLYKN